MHSGGERWGGGGERFDVYIGDLTARVNPDFGMWTMPCCVCSVVSGSAAGSQACRRVPEEKKLMCCLTKGATVLV